jgi:DNA-binding NarL/FixJ family response regulator
MPADAVHRIRVLLADGEPLVRGGFCMLLDFEPDIHVVGEAGDGQEAVEMAARLRPNVVVMDVRMPRMDGVEATRRITADLNASVAAADPSVQPVDDELADCVAVLILSTFHEDAEVRSALRAGASGFLLKSAVPSDLAAAVRAVCRGDAWLDPAVARGLLREFADGPVSVAPTVEEMRRLTAREREVLALAAYGLTNGQIAERLVVSGATVKTHVARVLIKLGLHDRAQAVAAAYQTGLVRAGQAPLAFP